VPISIADHHFLINTVSLAERALDLDDLWSSKAFDQEASPEDRQAVASVGREMESLLLDVAGRTDAIMRITEGFSPSPDALKSISELDDLNRSFNFGRMRG
jgi:hypothetical protein